MIALLVGCSFGTVEQGRAVGLDLATHRVTVVVEPSGEARTYVLPDEPAAPLESL